MCSKTRHFRSLCYIERERNLDHNFLHSSNHESRMRRAFQRVYNNSKLSSSHPLTRFVFSSIKNITCLNLPCGATSVQYEPPCSFFHKIKSPCRRLLVLEALKSGREANLYRKRNPGFFFFPPGLSCSLSLQHLSTNIAIYKQLYHNDFPVHCIIAASDLLCSRPKLRDLNTDIQQWCSLQGYS